MFFFKNKNLLIIKNLRKSYDIICFLKYFEIIVFLNKFIFKTIIRLIHINIKNIFKEKIKKVKQYFISTEVTKYEKSPKNNVPKAVKVALKSAEFKSSIK